MSSQYRSLHQLLGEKRSVKPPLGQPFLDDPVHGRNHAPIGACISKNIYIYKYLVYYNICDGNPRKHTTLFMSSGRPKYDAVLTRLRHVSLVELLIQVTNKLPR